MEERTEREGAILRLFERRMHLSNECIVTVLDSFSTSFLNYRRR